MCPRFWQESKWSFVPGGQTLASSLPLSCHRGHRSHEVQRAKAVRHLGAEHSASGTSAQVDFWGPAPDTNGADSSRRMARASAEARVPSEEASALARQALAGPKTVRQGGRLKLWIVFGRSFNRQSAAAEARTWLSPAEWCCNQIRTLILLRRRGGDVTWSSAFPANPTKGDPAGAFVLACVPCRCPGWMGQTVNPRGRCGESYHLRVPWPRARTMRVVGVIGVS